MKLFACPRSGPFASQAIAQLKGPQCFTKFPRYPVRPARQQPWQQSRRTVAGTTTTPRNEPSSTSTPRAAEAQSTETSDLSISNQVRLLMRRVPYPVAIITATDPHGPIESAFRGMTVSSFSTVTLSPEPVISFNVKRPSETLSALQSSGRFLVHLLAPSKETAALARDFSKGNHNLSVVGGHGEFGFISHGPTNVDGANINNSSSSNRPIPLLRRRSADITTAVQKDLDFPFIFECKVHPHQLEVHDHTIVLGHIVDTILQRPLNGDAKGQKVGSAKELCLTYADTRFWEMGHEIKN